SHALGARAFSVNERIFFGAGQYQPSTAGGRRLLAHEVAHTLVSTPHVVHRQDASDSPPADAADSAFVGPPAPASPAPVSDDADTAAANADPAADPPQIELSDLMPWLITVTGNTDAAAVSRELYGIDLSATGEFVNATTVSMPFVGDLELRKISYPDLL